MEESSPDLLETLRRGVEAINRGDFDAAVAPYSTDCVWQGTMGVYEGRDAIRTLLEDWVGAYDDFLLQVEALDNLDNGITYGVFLHRGRPKGSSGEFVQVRHAAVAAWKDGFIERYTLRDDIAKTRITAERLAEERG